jgi:YfiH family protein
MAPVAFFPFIFPAVPGVGCVFTSRQGGVSEPPHDSANLSFEVGDDPEAVRRNRRLLHDRLGLAGWCECRQIHGDVIHFDPAPGAPEAEPTLEGDGLATSAPGIGLVIKTADCQPLLLTHRSGRHVAALHAGWRGNQINFPGSGVARFCETYGLSPADVFAVRGPSLGPAAAEFVNFDSDFGPGFEAYYDRATRTADLWRMTRDQLRRAGVPPAQTFGMDLCTMTREDLFFSYRRACAAPVKETGRQAGIIWIKK